MSKDGKGNTRSIDFLVLDLVKYQDTGEVTKVQDIERLINAAMVVKSRTELYRAAQQTLVLSIETLADETHSAMKFADIFVKLKKEGRYQYVLCNKYWWKTPNRIKEAYNFQHRLDFSEMMRVMPKVSPRDFVNPFHIEAACEFRALFKNKNCQESIYNLFKDKQGTILYDDSQGHAEQIGEIFDIGYFYEVMHYRRDLDLRSPAKHRPYGKFLLERGFPKQGRFLLPDYLKKGDVTPRKYNRKQHRWYTNNFDNTEWTIEKLKQKKLPDIKPLLQFFPHKQLGKIKMIEDVWVSVNGQKNMFELFSSRIHMQLEKELRQLERIPGNKPEYVYLSMFLVNLYFGFCDLYNFETIQIVMDYVDSWYARLFGSAMQFNDNLTHKLPCCNNDRHFIELAPYNAESNLRRTTYINNDGDGECCYKYMMKRCLPNVRIQP